VGGVACGGGGEGGGGGGWGDSTVFHARAVAERSSRRSAQLRRDDRSVQHFLLALLHDGPPRVGGVCLTVVAAVTLMMHESSVPPLFLPVWLKSF